MTHHMHGTASLFGEEVPASMLGCPPAPALGTQSATPQALLLENDLMPVSSAWRRLVTRGFAMSRADSVDAALALVGKHPFDVAVIDLRPDLLGFEAVCRLRIAGSDIPVLFILASSSPSARAKAFAVGADDVISGSLDPVDLCDRVVALVLRGRRPVRPRLQIGGLVLNLQARQASVDGEEVALTATEYTVLEALAMRHGAPVARTALLDHLQGSSSVPITTVVRRLGEKLNAVGSTARIVAFGRHGYAVRVVTQEHRASLIGGATRPSISQAA